MSQKTPQLPEESALRVFDAQQLGELARGYDQAKPEQEAREHRLGYEVRERSQPEEAGEHEDPAAQDRQGCGQGEILVSVAGRNLADSGCRNGGRRRGGADRELPRGSESRVAEQRQGVANSAACAKRWSSPP
jgi:hypothetical protein